MAGRILKPRKKNVTFIRSKSVYEHHSAKQVLLIEMFHIGIVENNSFSPHVFFNSWSMTGAIKKLNFKFYLVLYLKKQMWLSVVPCWPA